MKEKYSEQQTEGLQSIFIEGVRQTVQDMAALRDSRREQQARLFRLAETESRNRLGGSLPDGTPNQMLPLKRTVVMFSLIIPGPIKNNRFLEAVFDEGCRAFLERLAPERYADKIPVSKGTVHTPFIAAYHEDRKPAGCTAFWLLDAQAETIKRYTTALERTHPLGLLWDFDVFSAFEQKLSASELGLPARSCLICSNPSKVCARSRTHSVSELQAKISDIINLFGNFRF